MGGYSGWGGNDDEQEQRDGATNLLTFGARSEDAESAPNAESLPGPQPSEGNFSTGEGASGSGMSRASATNRQPTPPTYSPSPLPAAPDRQLGREQDLDQQIGKFSTALSHNDPALKPRWYERLAGGLAGGMIGVRNPTEGVQAGASVINRRFNQAEQARQTNLKGAERQLGDLRAQRQDANQSFEQQMQLHTAGTQDYNAQERAYQGQVTANDRAEQAQQRNQSIAPDSEAPDDPQNPMGTWHATTTGGKSIAMHGPPDAWMKTPAGVQATRDQYIKQHNLTGDDAKFYSANGKLKEPGQQINIHTPSADSEKYHDLKAQFKREKGRDPNMQELESMMQGEHASGAPRTPQNADENVEAVVGKATQDKQAFADGWQRDEDGSYTSVDLNKHISGPEFNARIDKFRTDANTKLAKYGATIDGQGNVQRNGARGAQAPQQGAPQAQPQQQPASAPQQGQPGQTVRIQSSDGKLYDIPAKNLQAALKRGAKQVQ